MTRSFVHCGVALLVLSCSVGTFSEEGIPSLVKRVEPSVLLVQTFATSGKRVAQGSAFFVNTEGDIVTNRHVLIGADRAQVRVRDGRIFTVTGVLAEDRARDLVLLSLDAPAGIGRPLAVAQKLPEPGEPVVVIGSPLGLEQTVTDGIVSAVRVVKPMGQVIQMSAPISQGSSGSPVVNMAGEVVGVASFIRQDGQNLNFAVPASGIACSQHGPRRPLSSLAEPARAPEPTSAEKAYLDGVALLSQRNYAKALPSFEGAVFSRPSYSEAYYQIGVCQEALGRWREATEGFQSAVLLNPQVADYSIRLGKALAHQGEDAHALEAFQQAVRLEPDNASALIGLGLAFGRLGKVPESLGACQQAARLKPDSEQAALALGDVYAKARRYEQSAEAFKRAIRLEPENPEGHCGVGQALMKLGHSKDAADAFKEAIRLDPKNPSAHYGLGVCALALDNRGLALDEYKILKGLDRALAEDLFASIY